MIATARVQAARSVDSTLVMLYLRLGHRIVSTLAQQLSAEFGLGFGEKNLRRMQQFAEMLSEERIVAALRRQSGWTPFVLLIPIKDEPFPGGDR
jgi:hypothetical protein